MNTAEIKTIEPKTDLPAIVARYGEYTISLTQKFDFFVSGEGEEFSTRADSLEAAKKAIEDRRNEIVRDDKSAHNVELNVFTDAAVRLTIKGIDSRSGRAKFAEKGADPKYDRSFYPATPWTEALLKERNTLQRRLGEITDALQGASFRLFGSGRIEAQYLPGRLKNLAKLYKKALYVATEREAGRDVKQNDDDD